MGKRKHYRVLTTPGIPCPRCNQPAETREHIAVGEKQLSQPFYYSRWFNCNNQDCATTVFMTEEYKVMNENSAARAFLQRQQELEEYEQQLHFLRDL